MEHFQDAVRFYLCTKHNHINYLMSLHYAILTSIRKLFVRKKFISSIAFLLIAFVSFSQNTENQGTNNIKIRGKIIDARTFEPIAFANVLLVGTSKGTQTDMNGNYVLTVSGSSQIKLQVTFIGYFKEIKEVNTAKVSSVNFRLRAENFNLQEVAVKGKKERYRNKDNPAVVLIRKVIENKKVNRKEAFDFYKYNQYEKLEFDLSNVTDKFKNRKGLQRFDFIFDYLDTSQVTGMVNLPMYLKESVSDVYYRKDPKAKKEYVSARKETDLGGFLSPKNGISNYLESLYQDVNIYDNNITLLANSFLGPVSPLSPTFYKFVIVDTLKYKGVKCVNLGFAPRNPEDRLFQGSLFIALDSTYAIRKVEMGFSKDVNINFVKDLRIVQEYNDVPGIGLILTRDELIIDFGIFKKEMGMGLFGQRTVSYKDWEVNKTIPDEKFKGVVAVINLPGASREDKSWDSLRHEPLAKKEMGIYKLVDTLKKSPPFQRLLNLATLVLTGWKPFSVFEIGPVNSFYSYNPIEGVRLRFGGRTMTEWNSKILLEYYGAYGLTDQRFKYYGGITYSLSDRTVFEYPQKLLRVTVQNEARIPGQELQFVQEDNVLLSAKRGLNDKMTYNFSYGFEWVNESDKGLSFTLGIKHLRQERTGNLFFTTLGNDVNPAKDIQSFTTTEANVSLRFAPNEQYFIGKNFRVPIVNRFPIFKLNYTAGITGLLGGQYDYHRLQFSFFKRFFTPPFGYTDLTVEGANTFGRLPFMLLGIHRANQTYSFQIEAYNLMNFMEFVSDHYVGAFVEQEFNGALLNKIPLIKKLGLRELVTFKILWGGLRQENIPTVENGLWQFPTDANGSPIMFTLDSRPYIEAGFGVANVFKLFRIYLVKRFTYLEKPNIADGYNLRARVKFDF
jgi:Family of unknown function (DUF5686)/CarboxypepD_reg-like domain